MSATGGGHDHEQRPRVALSVGDVAGVGPELLARALADREIRESIEPVVFGPCDVMQRAAQLIGAPLEFRKPVETRDGCDERIACVDPEEDGAAAVAPGRVDPRAGRIAYQALSSAIGAALAGDVDAIVTAPLSKLALHRAGHHVPGHTEILANACGVNEVAMMLYVPPGPIVRSPHGLGVAHVTLHTSVASVPGLLSRESIVSTIRLVDTFMREIGCQSPRIGVCALNPHASEGGLFGGEEQSLIEPAVRLAGGPNGCSAEGPFPADTLIARAVSGEFDGVVAMYHDQGHIAIKLIAFHSAVNVTLGLPIVRTSPAQGTAFDIAWRGAANPDGMIAAIQVARKLAIGRCADRSIR